jgi:hypothetical protein
MERTNGHYTDVLGSEFSKTRGPLSRWFHAFASFFWDDSGVYPAVESAAFPKREKRLPRAYQRDGSWKDSE